MALPAATISLLVIEPGLERLTPSLVGQGKDQRFAVTFQPLPYASNLRYRLLRSSDLATWETVDEAGPRLTASFVLKDNLPVSRSQPRFFRVQLQRD